MLRIASCTHILAAPGSRHLAQRCGGTRYSRQPSTGATDRKSTRLNSSHTVISYAVFCLKKKKTLKHCVKGRRLTCQRLSQANAAVMNSTHAHAARHELWGVQAVRPTPTSGRWLEDESHR